MNSHGVRKAKALSIFVFLLVAVIFISEEKIIVPVHTLEDGVYLSDVDGEIDVGSWSVPFVYDWDSDGRGDLLVGYKINRHGYVAFFRNIGVGGNPQLDRPILLRSEEGYIDLAADG